MKTIPVELDYNDLLAIAKLIQMYRHPSEVPFYGPDYFKGLSQAVDRLDEKLGTPKINRFRIQQGQEEPPA